jgi:uncharacterized DUF497 family protein
MYDDVIFKNRFIWNRDKNEINKRKHLISFENASDVFDDVFAVVVYDHENSTDNEHRYRITGYIQSRPSFVTVSFTQRALTRIFSARKANPYEKGDYYANVKRNI